MRRLAALLILSLVLIGLVPSPAQAAEPASSGNASISGTVTVLSQQVSSPAQGFAHLYRWFPGDDEPTWTGKNSTFSNGAYRFDGLEPGDYALMFAATAAGGAQWWSGTGPAGSPMRVTVSESAGVIVDAQLVAPVQVLASIEYRLAAGGPLRHLEEQVIDAFRLDEQTGRYEYDSYLHVKSTVDPQPQGGLAPGTYRFAARGGSVQVDGQWYDLARKFFGDAVHLSDARTVTIRPGDVVDLGSIVLEKFEFRERRIAGADRFDTSVEVSRTLVADGDRAPVVYVVNGFGFPDALAAGPAAAHAGGVVLLTAPGGLSPAVSAELERIDPHRVVVVGGPAAISDAVVLQTAALLSPDATVQRIGGADRFETADMIVRDAFPHADAAYIASGLQFPDALSAGAAAAAVGAPVLLVGAESGLDARTKTLIEDLGVDEAVVAGGPAAVSAAIEQGLVSVLGAEHVSRFSGADRFETAFEVNWASFHQPDHVIVASGLQFPDGLSAIPLAGALDAPLYLSRPDCVPWPTRGQTWQSTIALITIVGGRSAVADVNISVPGC